MAIDVADGAPERPGSWGDEPDLSLPGVRNLHRAFHPALPPRQRAGALLNLPGCPVGVQINCRTKGSRDSFPTQSPRWEVC